MQPVPEIISSIVVSQRDCEAHIRAKKKARLQDEPFS